MAQTAHRIVVIDDERSMREFLQILLQREGYSVALAHGVQRGLRMCQEHQPDLVFSDLRLPDGSGLDVLRWLRENQPEVQVIMMTAYASAENAVEAMHLGAYDYQIKPFKVSEVRVLTQKALEKVRLIRENQQLSAKLQGFVGRSKLIGRSPALTEVLSLIGMVAPSMANVLIEGESGTGKELVARQIHESSPRADQPFVPVNCGAIPESLIEAELFGHVAGAYTGATKSRSGLFEAAEGGTLLLDEIGELPISMQVKLLRVLQERVVRRVGEDRERRINARILASTNRDLQEMVSRGEFREDLFYRLNVVKIRVPPLRERIEDIPLLVRVFVEHYSKELQKPVRVVSAQAMRALTLHPFPGNVRELQNIVERAITLNSGDSIELTHLPLEVQGEHSSAGAAPLPFPEQGVMLEAELERIERDYIEQAMQRCGGIKTQAAKLLGLSFRSLRYRMKKLGMEELEAEEA